MNKNLLLVYYHPVVLDLAETFSRIFDNVTICSNRNLKDNYGSFVDLEKKIRSNPYLDNVGFIPSNIAHINIKDYDLVGLDGVFDGDDFFMTLCESSGVPYFCINGYPHQTDEPSWNILSFSWHLPQLQHKLRVSKSQMIEEGWLEAATAALPYRNDANVKYIGKKNICVFYPEMNEAKRFADKIDWELEAWKKKPRTIGSYIHRYEECNPVCYYLFKKFKEDMLKKDVHVENYSGLSQQEVFEKMKDSIGTVHFKHGDCPGISVLESQILGIPIITMTPFVEASFNQEVLLDSMNSVVADSYEELIERVPNDLTILVGGVHVWDLTDYNRQQKKLVRFFERCMK